MQKEMTLALQLQMTALISILAEKGIIDRPAFLELCRHTIAETQQANSDTDWRMIKALIEGIPH
jgi:hypothetical protein